MDALTTATAVAAAFTGAGVLLALWLQVARPALRQPRLTMTFVPDSDDLAHIRADDSMWLRFRVENARGKDTAQSVEVLLVTATLKDAQKPNGEEPFPTRRLKWADVGPDKVNIPPGLFRYVDVGFIRPRVKDVFVFRFSPPVLNEYTLSSESPKTPMTKRWLQVFDRKGDLAKGEDARYWIQKPGIYELAFAVSAARLNASFFTAQIELHTTQVGGTSRLGISVATPPTAVTHLPLS